MEGGGRKRGKERVNILGRERPATAATAEGTGALKCRKRAVSSAKVL